LISRREYDGELTAGDFIDEIDDAQREISAYSLYSLIERKHRELRRIEYLISRILKEEEFGLCEECGAQIPKERLLIVPEATLCVACLASPASGRWKGWTDGPWHPGLPPALALERR